MLKNQPLARWGACVITVLMSIGALSIARADDRWGDDVLILDDGARAEGCFQMAIGPTGTYFGLIEFPDDDRLCVLCSSDAGVTWEIKHTISFAGSGWEGAALGVPQTVDDYLYVAYEYNNILSVQRFRTTTWQYVVCSVTTADFDDGIRDLCFTFDDVDHGAAYNVYLSYAFKSSENPDRWEIRVARSSDHGYYWSNATILDYVLGHDADYADGVLHVAAFTPLTEPGQSIQHVSSLDRGVTWSDLHIIEETSITEVVMELRLEAVQATNVTVVSYAKWVNDEIDIYCQESEDGGVTWENPYCLVCDQGVDAQYHELASSATEPKIFLAYLEEGWVGVTSAQVTTSIPWSIPQVISDSPDALNHHRPTIGVTPGPSPGALVAWTDERTATRAIYGDRSSSLIFYMAPDGSGAFPTLQMAIAQVPSGSILELADGIYQGEENRDLDFGGKNLTLRSASMNPALCILDCEGGARDAHRAMRFHSGEGPQTRIEGITIRNGYEWDGGGISCVQGSSPTIVGCVFEDCVAQDDGGALHCADGSSPLVQNCVFVNNSAGDTGGAVHVRASSPAFEECEIVGSIAGGSGGGMSFNTQSVCTAYRCVLRANQAMTDGGGIDVSDNSQVSLEDCTIYGNEAMGVGAGLAARGSSHVEVAGTTIAHNAAAAGAGIHAGAESMVYLGRSIVAFNGPGEAIACAGYAEADLSCCDVFGNEGGDWTGCIETQYGISYNIGSDPRFCDASGGDYSLAENSLCSQDHSPCSEQIGARGVGCAPIVFTYNLAADGSGDFPSIQAAVAAAAHGDVIALADGHYTAEDDHNVDFLGKAITIRSQSGDPEACTIACAFANPERAFLFLSGEGPESRLENLRIKDAVADTGAAVLCVGASPTLSNIVFLSGYATMVGGGVACLNGAAPTLVGCQFNGNAAEDDGGGIWCYESSPVVTDCYFFYNDADDNGAGFYATDNCEPHLADCVFERNNALDCGAGAGLVRSGGRIENCTFFDGVTTVGGGALFFHGYCTTRVSNCTAFNNTGAEGSSVLIRHYSTPVFENTLLSYGNGGPGVTCMSASSVSLSCCNIFGHAGGDWVGCIADQLGINGNIGEDPLYCDPYGDDFTLQSTSGCAAENNPACGQIGAWGVGCDGYLFPPEHYYVGAGPMDMAVGDFNQDPYPDLVVADFDAGRLAILYGTSVGTFVDPWWIWWGDVPRAVAVGDLNGDGWKDLVAAEPASDRVAVLLGQGIGMFEAPVHYPVGDGPNDVALADLNGDDALDVVVTGHWSDTIEILLGTGYGTLEPATTQTVGSRPQSIALEDIDGDNLPDCVVANSASPYVTFMRGLGDGSFEAGVDYQVGYGPVSVAIGDLNRDTHLDLATANHVVNTASVLLGNGDGTFQSAESYPTGGDPSAVAIGDIDGDQWPDLVVANGGSNSIAVFRNAGTRALEEPVFYTVGEQPSALTMADVDGNGSPDVQVVGYADSSLTVLRSPDPGSSGVLTPELSAVSGAAFAIHPNPILGGTTCFFGAHTPAWGDLAVYDVAGREIWRRRIAGETSAVWNGRSAAGDPAAPGVYYLRWQPDEGSRRIVRAVLVR